MITGEMAREQIRDRVREAERDRRTSSFRRVRTREGMSGLLAAVASLRTSRQVEAGASAGRVRTV